jgi:hypothetical protein
MKKYYCLFLLVILIATSCEKDDFCIDPITPNLILRFYDADNPTTLLSVEELTIWPEGLQDTLVSNQTLDSIALPLNVNDIETIYNFRMGDIVDQITIRYTVNEVFVSRSCGFKATFEEVDASLETTNWIQSLEIISTTIEDESAAHIEIFH